MKNNILAISTSEIKISVIINDIDTLRAVKKLHNIFELGLKMEIRPHRKILRKKTKKIKVGNLFVGGDSPITVQSMTNTLTTDTKATINQINELIDVGAEIVRVSCPDEQSTKSLKRDY